MQDVTYVKCRGFHIFCIMDSFLNENEKLLIFEIQISINFSN